MRVLAPAKINLHLRVGRRSDDGFHPLVSWMCTVRLFDTLTIQPAPGAKQLIELRCTDGSLPTDSRNLVIRAAEALARQARGSGEAPPEARHASAARIQPVRIELAKQIPIGGGLGGGSSDAAATLVGLNRLWRTDCTPQQLSQIAAQLGSDVPFFLFGPSSICTGRGEVVTPIAAPAAGFALLILPGIAVATADVYRRFDELNLPSSNQFDSATNNLRDTVAQSAEMLLPRLVNDLEAAAFDLHPHLAALRSDAERLLGRPVRMSGSGSSLFTLFDSLAEAQAASEVLKEGMKKHFAAARVMTLDVGRAAVE